jgi:exodeoxyribonuclease VII large subunit
MFRGRNALLRFTPANGQRVLARVRVTLYEARGEYQLQVEHLEDSGVGALRREYERLKARLDAEGLFDPARKRPLPRVPGCIGVVTSPTGAAVRDILNILGRRFAAARVVIYPTAVQGRDAVPQIIEALSLAARRQECDVLIVARGGGSLEDLWAFNERIVADAAFARRNVPIVSAIGHETDTSVLDLVADLRASTPTQAATILVPDAEALRERVSFLSGRLQQAGRSAIRDRREALLRLRNHPYLRRPDGAIAAARERLDRAAVGLVRAAERRLERERRELATAAARWRAIRPEARLARGVEALGRESERLVAALRRRVAGHRTLVAALERQLVAVGPESVLARGFSYTQRDDGSLVRSSADVGPGQRIRTVVADGSFVSEVVAEGEARSPRTPKRPLPPSDREAGLFGDS